MLAYKSTANPATEDLPVQNENQANDSLILESEVSKLITVQVKTLQAWRVSGQGPAFLKLGTGLRAPVRYRRSDVDKFLADSVVRSTSAQAVRTAQAGC